MESNVILMNKNENEYNNLNTTFNGRWSYNIEDIFRLEDSVESVVKLIVPNREMLGVGQGANLQSSIADSLKDAYRKMFILDELSTTAVVNTDNNMFENLEVLSEQTIKSMPYNTATVPLNNTSEPIEEIIEEKEEVPTEDFMALDDIPYDDIPVKVDEEKEKADRLAKEQRDNSTPIPGSDITQSQIDFMNEFKEHNEIDTDEKFDYYVKTWSTHNSIDDIVTKKQLIGAGRDVLESFIIWIKKFQPILDNGIVSPL